MCGGGDGILRARHQVGRAGWSATDWLTDWLAGVKKRRPPLVACTGRHNNPLVLIGADRQRFLGEETRGVHFHQHWRRFHCSQTLPLVGRWTREGETKTPIEEKRKEKKTFVVMMYFPVRPQREPCALRLFECISTLSMLLPWCDYVASSPALNAR